MKLFRFAFLLLTVVGFQMRDAAEAGQGNYKLGNWSVPAKVTLESAAGPIEASIKTIHIQRTTENHTEQFALDLVSSKTFSDLVTPPADRYLIIGGRICGLYAEGARLKFRFNRADSGEAHSRSIEETMPKLARDAGSAFGRDEEIFQFDLTFIFGTHFFGPPFDARGSIYPLGIVDARFQNENLVIGLSNKLHSAMTVTIEPKMNLIAASNDGSDLVLLRSGRVPSLAPGWGRPNTIPLRGLFEETPIPRCGAYIELPSGPEGSWTYQALAAWSPEGKLWFGDGSCRLAEFAGGIVGVKTGANATLELYHSNSVLHHGPGAVTAFEGKLEEFSGAISKGIFPKQIKINLAGLFPKVPIKYDPDLKVRSLRISGKNLEIAIRTNDNRVELTVVVDAQFSVVSLKNELSAGR
jgi:hypothetical protein